MFFQLLQFGPMSVDMSSIFLILILTVADLVLLKLGLIITKAERWKKMKWVAASFFIQFGVIFAIGSPLFLLGMIGAFNGDFGAIIPVVIICAFVDINVVNAIHRIGLKRSLVIVAIIIIPMVFVMSGLGPLISQLTRI
jgi:hypothetical protein